MQDDTGGDVIQGDREKGRRAGGRVGALFALVGRTHPVLPLASHRFRFLYVATTDQPRNNKMTRMIRSRTTSKTGPCRPDFYLGRRRRRRETRDGVLNPPKKETERKGRLGD
jgi:hypothetical protein